MRTRLLAGLLAAALIASGCGDDDDEAADDTTADTTTETTAEPTTETTEEQPTETTSDDAAAADADLQLSSTDLGEILVDDDGNTVYLFLPDEQGEPTCDDACAETWPPVGDLESVGEGLDPELLGTAERADGEIQATYNGWPLYSFANDAAPGDTNGQGINDVWYVVDAAGTPVQG